MVALSLTFVITGAFDAWLSQMSPTAELHKVLEGTLIVLLVYQIVLHDAEIRTYSIGLVLSISLVAIQLLAVPYYLLRSRGWRRGAIASVKAAGIFLGFAVLYVVSFMVVLAFMGVPLFQE